jgi:CRP-like cAMP-binding protein
MEEVLVCSFTRERFEKLVLEHPNIGLQVIKNLSSRITRAMKSLKKAGKIIQQGKELSLPFEAEWM